MADGQATYTFLSVARRGMAARIRPAAGAQPGDGAVTLPVALRVNARPPLEIAVQLHGPGDVIGIDAGAVIRTEPRHLAVDFEPNYLPAIEFDTPDFPWLLTSAAPRLDNGALSPWIALVAVPRDKGDIKMTADGSQPLPVLSCLREELPDLHESSAWAHAQLTGNQYQGDLRAALAGDPALNLSRLICPRRLQPNTQYLACLVPAFQAGVQAGLGQPVTSHNLEPAWGSPGEPIDAPIKLPVYYHWEFGTGPAGDFESLVRRLKPATLPPDVGLRPMNVGEPGLSLPPAGTVLGQEGVLWTADTKPSEWPPAQRTPFQDALEALLNATANDVAEAASASEPVVGPPLYGSWHADVRTLNDRSVAWLRDLNLDPRHRVAASLGTLVVQNQQEALVASAWEQLGEIRRANQLLRQAQLARAVGAAIHQQRLARLPDDVLLQVTAAVHTRVRIDAFTLKHRVRQSALSDAALGSAFRRVLRPRGPLIRRLLKPSARRSGGIVRRLAAREIDAVRPRPALSGMVSIDAVAEAVRAASPARPPTPATGIRFRDATPEAVRTAAPRSPLDEPTARRGRGSRPPAGVPADPAAERFKIAALSHQLHVMRDTALAAPAVKPALDLPAVRTRLLAEVDPRVTIPKVARLRIKTRDAVWQRPDPLEPLLEQPTFRQPMFEALKEASPDVVLPGLARVPVNALVIVKPNPRFIEAYMAGLNHEMSRELLWREFPTGLRGTYFTRFWDVRDADAAADIPPLADWQRPLGQNMTGVTADTLLVLLIRGELLRRYPDTAIYAVEAVRNGTRHLGERHEFALFRGRIEPDITFVGFNLSLEEVRGSDHHPGWYFVLQQQPTAPRFGFDEQSDPPAVETIDSWSDLTWAHVLAAQPASRPATHVGVEGGLTNLKIGDVVWGFNSAHMATLALQRPVRIAIHAAGMLPETV